MWVLPVVSADTIFVCRPWNLFRKWYSSSRSPPRGLFCPTIEVPLKFPVIMLCSIWAIIHLLTISDACILTRLRTPSIETDPRWRLHASDRKCVVTGLIVSHQSCLFAAVLSRPARAPVVFVPSNQKWLCSIVSAWRQQTAPRGELLAVWRTITL